MKTRAFALGLATVLCALPLLAQNIPAGDDVWASVGGGATEVTLSPGQWSTLCGATVSANTAVQLKGFNIPGQGEGDTIVRRLETALLPSIGSSDEVPIQLQNLSMISDGSHPCSPKTLRVTHDGTQRVGSMTITKTSSAGGTFLAEVPVSAVIETTDGTGNPVYVDGSLGDESASPWSYAAPTSGFTAATTAAAPWHPSVDPVTKKAVRTCRRGNKILPARHCYQPRPPCQTANPGVINGATIGDDTITPIGGGGDTVPVEACTYDATPVGGTVN